MHDIEGERMKLEPHGVGRERSARQSRSLDRAFALLRSWSFTENCHASATGGDLRSLMRHKSLKRVTLSSIDRLLIPAQQVSSHMS